MSSSGQDCIMEGLKVRRKVYEIKGILENEHKKR